MFAALRLRLVDDWRQAWQWSSIRILALSGALSLALAKCPPSVSAYVPDWIMSALSTFVLLAPVLAMAARVTTTEQPNAPVPDKPLS